jgi:hypothetical protein
MKTRKYKRVKISAVSTINNVDCAVINVSKEGMMLHGNLKTNQKDVNIQLKINGKWQELKGMVVWCLDGATPKLKRMGIYIIDAPHEYREFIQNLYLETDEKE